jgi:hypothetical protein
MSGEAAAPTAVEFVLAQEKPRMIESLLRTVEDTYVPQRLQTTASGCNLVYPGSPGSQSPSVRAGSAVVRRACIAWSKSSRRMRHSLPSL